MDILRVNMYSILGVYIIFNSSLKCGHNQAKTNSISILSMKKWTHLIDKQCDTEKFREIPVMGEMGISFENILVYNIN